MAEAWALIRRQRHLIWTMAKREISDRYAGQMIGVFWAVGHPVLMMAVYLFVFGYVFKMKIGGTTELPLDYTTYLLAGLAPWLGVQDMLAKAPIAVTNNASLVKQVVFPLEVLPLKGVVASVLTEIVTFCVLMAYVVISYRTLPATFVLLPIVIGLQIAQGCGISFLLSAVGVYVRDLKDVVQVLTLISIYLLPVFYLPSMVPPIFKPLLYLNPFSYLIWCFQDACYFGRIAHPWAWVASTIFSALFFVTGWRVFRRLKPMFGNAL